MNVCKLELEKHIGDASTYTEEENCNEKKRKKKIVKVCNVNEEIVECYFAVGKYAFHLLNSSLTYCCNYEDREKCHLSRE